MPLDTRKSKKLGVLIGGILILAGVWAVFFVDWKKEKPEEPQPVRPLKMFHVGQTSSPAERDYPGKVTAKDTVVLAFQVEGQVVEFPVLKGREVSRGDLLAKLDDRDYRNRFNAAKAVYDQAKVQLERIQKAVESGAVSRTDLTNAQADFQRAEANFQIAQKALDDTVIKSPYDAIIANTYIDNYENVQAKQPIVGVQNIESVKVEASVPQERVLKAKAVQGKFDYFVTFDALPDVEFKVDVVEYTAEADPKTQTYTVTFTMPVQDTYNIFPGMTATVREKPKEGAFPKSGHLLVPIDAVPVDGQGQYYVWKVTEQDGRSTVHRQNVTVGNAMGDKIEILNGLSEGDRIAAQGVHLLQEGQQVREYTSNSEES